MPSAVADKNKDWSAAENRINLGGLISVQSKTTPSDMTSDAEKKHDSDDELEDIGDDVLSRIREKRLAELKKKGNRNQEFLQLGHGKYNEVSQDQFLTEVTKSKYVVCHFYHAGFERCKILDKHFEILAARHLPTKFIKVDAEKSPFFVAKLQVKVLPAVVFFKDGIAIDRMVGFEDVGGADDFKTEALEKRIATAGLVLTEQQQKALSDDADGSEEQDKPKSSIRKSEQASQWNQDDSDPEDD
jgi:thioredoxin-like negative regulator of GroEL